MRILTVLTPWVVAQETVSSENFIIMTNLLVVLASLLLAWATLHAAAKERRQERRFLLRLVRILVRPASGTHRKD